MNFDYMNLALSCANRAFELGEVPVGAVIVKDNKIISSAFNQKESNKCAIDHAEILAIKEAERIIDNWRLEDCDIYVTLDPCPMCASAIKQARIRNVYSALENSDNKNSFILHSIFDSSDNNSTVNFYTNLAVNDSKKLLNDFFKEQRNK